MTAHMATTTKKTTLGPLMRRWPVVAGLGFMALMVFGLTSGVDVAAVLAAAAVVYLGSAALRKPAAAWPLFFGTAVVITLVKLFGGGLDPTWPVLGVGVLLLAYGLIRGAVRPRSGLPLQSLALLGFGVVAAVALLVAPTVGGYLVALGLLGHAGWDLYHHRTGRVVSRSLAEFCLVLDASLAVAIVVVTATA